MYGALNTSSASAGRHMSVLGGALIVKVPVVSSGSVAPLAECQVRETMLG